MCRIVFALGWHRRYSNAIGWHRSKTYKANNAAYRNRFDRYTAPPEFKLRNTGVFFGPFFSRKDVFSFYRIGNCKLMVVRNLPSCFSHLPTISPEAVNWHNAHLTTHSAESPTKLKRAFAPCTSVCSLRPHETREPWVYPCCLREPWVYPCCSV
jgi:hypothetical protein